MTHDIEYILVDEKEIDEICNRVSNQIANDYANSPNKLVLISILKGSLMFTTEIMKRVNFPLELECMKVSSYGQGTVSSGNINIHLDFSREDMEHTDFIIVEDIIDSGRTLSHLTKLLEQRGAASVKTCTMLDKPDRRTVDFVPDYCGRVIPDHFVVGFGLDYNEKYRNLPYIGVLKPEIYS